MIGIYIVSRTQRVLIYLIPPFERTHRSIKLQFPIGRIRAFLHLKIDTSKILTLITSTYKKTLNITFHPFQPADMLP